MRWFLCLALCLGCARFDSPSSSETGRDAATSNLDGAVPNRDAGPCSVPAFAAAAIGANIISAGQSTPVVTVLPGDTVAFNSVGSCVQNGAIQYQWAFIGPSGDITSNAQDATGESPTIYATEPGNYSITLQAGNGQDTDMLQGVAFRVADWVPLDRFPGNTAGNVKDMSINGDTLWLAAQEGPYEVSLADPENGTFRLIDNIVGQSLPVYSHSVLYDPFPVNGSEELVWFASKFSDDKVYNVNFLATPDYESRDAIIPGAAGEIRDMARLQGAGIIVGGQRGVFSTSGNDNFIQDSDRDVNAVASAGGEKWAGSDDLFNLGVDEGRGDDIAHDVFGGFDKIRAILPVDTYLWLASEDKGTARFDRTNDSSVIYTTADGLPSDEVVALALDPQTGDIWAATTAGPARYKQDRGMWVQLIEGGISGRRDIEAIAFDGANGRRAVYVGGKNSGMTYVGVSAQ